MAPPNRCLLGTIGRVGSRQHMLPNPHGIGVRRVFPTTLALGILGSGFNYRISLRGESRMSIRDFGGSIRSTTFRLSALAAAVVGGLPFAASAQLEEIVVTATRRETDLQSTPLSIQAFTSEQLELSGLKRGQDLGIMVPNLVANPAGGGVSSPQFYIRGLPGVGIYIDGIWQSSWGFLESNFTEVERVEVLRGPQGTLFGRNTNGGAINITSRAPAEEFGARFGLEVGEFDRLFATASVDLPLSDTVKTKWMVSSQKIDGFLESRTVNRALGNQDDQMYRFDLLWDATDTFSLRFTANDEDKRGTEPRIIRITNENN